jgi:carboxypeptidase PM20D1
MKKALLALLVLLVVLAGIVLVRTAALTPPSMGERARVEIPLDADRLANRMSEALRFRTVSRQAPAVSDPQPREAFIRWLADTWPRLHRQLQVERVAGSTLLFTWPGSDRGRAPILLTSHYDVVPVIPGSEELWEQPPFSGAVVDGYVWGRGALDDKGAVICMLEAVDWLLAQGFQPNRTVYLSFGHDEELGGSEGAAGVAQLLAARGVRLAWSIDEGSFLIDQFLRGVDVPVAMINVAEKGSVTLELVARGEGGHSSTPPPETAVGVLAEAIVRVQASPMPGDLDGLMGDGFDALGPYMPFGQRILFANRWLFDPLLASILGRSNAGNAMMRTTTAPTMLSGSVKQNVLPIEAIGTINFRIHPRNSSDDVVAHVNRVVQDERVEVRRASGVSSEPSGVSSTTAEGYVEIANAVRDVIPNAVTMPGLTVGGTDSRHYGKVADDTYRFTPMILTRDDVPTVHGTNERVSIENLVRATTVYVQLLRRAAGDYSDASK